MRVELDAVIAEIVRTFDNSVLEAAPFFENVPRSHRMDLILASLEHLKIARTESCHNGADLRWRPSRDLRKCYGVKDHGMPDEAEEVRSSRTSSVLAEELSESLQASEGAIEEWAFDVGRQFSMYKIGLFEYGGKKDGLCQFHRTDKKIMVMGEDGNQHDFVDRYL
jgi:hypothetical protein